MDVGKLSGGLSSPVLNSQTPSSPVEAGVLSSSDTRSPSVAAANGQVQQAQTQGEPAREELQGKVSDILSRVQMVQRDLNFSIDDSSGQVVVKVIDGESGKVVRQIPSEEMLELAERLDDMRSLMRETKA